MFRQLERNVPSWMLQFQVNQISLKTPLNRSLSGGVNAASAGTLTFMVGAETDATFSEARSLLEGKTC